MRLTNNRPQYELDDAIQVVRGPEWGVFGVVIEIQGSQLLCWGRSPSQLGSVSFKFQVPAANVMYVGRAKMRPLKKGETKRDAPSQQTLAQAAKPVQGGAPPARRPSAAPAPPPSPAQVRPGARIQERKLRPEEPARPAEPQFGGVDSESAIIRPKPVLEKIDPNLLRPVVYHRPSSQDAHRLPPAAEAEAPQPELPMIDDGAQYERPAGAGQTTETQNVEVSAEGQDAGADDQGQGPVVPIPLARAKRVPRKRQAPDENIV